MICPLKSKTSPGLHFFSSSFISNPATGFWRKLFLSLCLLIQTKYYKNEKKLKKKERKKNNSTLLLVMWKWIIARRSDSISIPQHVLQVLPTYHNTLLLMSLTVTPGLGPLSITFFPFHAAENVSVFTLKIKRFQTASSSLQGN